MPCQCKDLYEVDGEWTCNACGLVHDKVLLSYDHDELAGPTIVDFVEGCERPVGTQTQNARRMALLSEMHFFDALADQHRLSRAVTTRAAEKFIDIIQHHVIRGNNRKRHRAACLYHAFREMKQPRSVAYVAFLLGVTETDVLAGCNIMDALPQSTVIDFMDDGNHAITACHQLGIFDFKFEQLANKMYLAASKHMVHHPMTIVGACLYVLIKESGLDITLDAIADACGMTRGLIEDTHKKIMACSAKIQHDMRFFS